jgi:dTDP-4-dehydrorhamnose 3,5-epimerase
MIFTATSLVGAYLIDLELREDDRGFFARAWCQEEFAAHNLVTRAAQANISYNRKRGTLRGMHYQIAPYAEVKLVRCIHGAIVDVIVDLRPESPTYMQHVAVELSAANRRALYVPEGFGHGFQTLEDDSEVLYQVSQMYTQHAERGIRHDDPALQITWPLPVSVISAKDMSWPAYQVSAHV